VLGACAAATPSIERRVTNNMLLSTAVQITAAVQVLQIIAPAKIETVHICTLGISVYSPEAIASIS